ncbi:unknown [Acetobacter sp. CAG:267]|nr:unknown [Acetobacter sp. CAG:267]
MPVCRQDFDFSVLHDLRFQNRPVGIHRHFKPLQMFQPGHFFLHVQFILLIHHRPVQIQRFLADIFFLQRLPLGQACRAVNARRPVLRNAVVHPFHGSVVGIVDCALDFQPQLVAAVFKIRNNRQAFRRAGQIVPRQCRNFLFRRKSKRSQAAVADHAPQHFVGNFLICHAGNSRLEQMFPQKGNVHFVIPVVIVIVRQIAQTQAVPVDENNVRPDRKRHNRLAPDPRNLRNFYIVRSQRRRRRHHVDIKFRRPRADKQNVPGINPFPLVKFGIEHRHRNRRFRRCLAAFHIGKVVIVARIRQADVRPGIGIDQKRKPVAEKSTGFRIFRSFVQHAEFPAYRAGLNGVRQARYRCSLYMLFVDNLRNLDNSRPVVQIFPQNAAVGTRPFAVHRFDASGLVSSDGLVILIV